MEFVPNELFQKCWINCTLLNNKWFPPHYICRKLLWPNNAFSLMSAYIFNRSELLAIFATLTRKKHHFASMMLTKYFNYLCLPTTRTQNHILNEIYNLYMYLCEWCCSSNVHSSWCLYTRCMYVCALSMHLEALINLGHEINCKHSRTTHKPPTLRRSCHLVHAHICIWRRHVKMCSRGVFGQPPGK